MRIAVISDLYGNLSATKAVVADIDGLEERVDSVFCLGDLVGRGAHPNEVVDLIRNREMSTVRGNYDEYAINRRDSLGIDFPSVERERDEVAALKWAREQLTDENRAFLKELPGDARLQISRSGRATDRVRETPSEADQARRGLLSTFLLGAAISEMGKSPRRLRPRRLLFVHGSPRDVIENLYPHTATSILLSIARRANADVIIHGHSHRSYQRDAGGVAFIGVGSVGWPLVAGQAEYAIVECLNFELTVEHRSVSYDPGSEARDVDLKGLPSFVSEALRHGTELSLVK